MADGVGTIRLDRPKMNALSVQMQDEIRAAAAEATEREDVRAVVLYGGERVFAAGVDIKEMADMSYVDMVRRSGALQSAFTTVARIPKPVVAAINGYALGGGFELTLCADIRFAAEDAVRPAGGAARRDARRRRNPTADPPDRPEQGEGGHLHRPLRQGRRSPRPGHGGQGDPCRSGVRRGVGLAGQFAGAASYALRAAKETIDRGLETDLDTGLEIERQQFAALFATEDRDIGMRSFVENGPGKARFVGR